MKHASAPVDQHPNPVELSERFVRHVRAEDPTDHFRDTLADLPESRLAPMDQHDRLAFWINVYNATVQDTLTDHPDRYQNRRQFFSNDHITVAGTALSLDDIEHGILRRSKWKYGLGYIPTPFPGAFERTHRVLELDYRIHFALNCGAASCPAIAAYTADNIDSTLDTATETYLESETIIDENTMYIPRILLWFRGDFGGRSGIKQLLTDAGIITPGTSPKLKYRDYDWSLALEKYTTHSSAP